MLHTIDSGIVPARTLAISERTVRMVSTAILLIFFFSGACGLIYETVWQKELCLIFGITTYATTTILASFMGGLALGSFLFGKYADRTKNPLRVYAILEAGVGIFALLFPFIVSGIMILFSGISMQFRPSPLMTAIIRFVLCFIVLAIPAILMGGTLPIMIRYYVRNIRVVGVGTGTLYGLNTLGGVAGCYCAGFIFMVIFGTHATLYGTAVVNLVLAGLAFIINLAYPHLASSKDVSDAGSVPGPASSLPNAEFQASAEASGKFMVPLLLTAAAVSGFCALAYEVLWTRNLTVFLQSNVYAFPTMLTSFLCGAALGSFLYAKIFDRTRRQIILLGILQILICITAVLTIFEFTRLGFLAVFLERILGRGWHASVGTGFIVSFMVMLLPSILMGISFPLITKIFTRSMERLGRSIGSLYSSNTLGCVLGSVCAGFAIIPLVGVVKGIALIAMLNAILGMVLLIFSPGTPRKRWIGSAAGILILIIVGYFASGWHIPVIFYSTKFARLMKEGDNVIYYKEGVGGTATVTEMTYHAFDGKRYRNIEVDGVGVAGDAPVLRMTQKLQGHIPLLLFKASTGRDPGMAFILGLGTGESSSCILRHDVKGVDCAELVAAEIGANRLFSHINNNLLNNPRFKLHINDARNHLLTASTKYDIIQSDSVHPSIAFNTYTKEYYELCRGRLSDNGVFSTWIPLYAFSEDQMKTLINTMLSVFPHVSIWWAPNYNNKHAILIGMNHRIKIDYELFKEEINKPSVKASLDEVDLDDMASVLGSFMADEMTLRDYAGDAPVNTDDNLILPYSIPKNRLKSEQTVPENISAFERWGMSILPYVEKLSAAERSEIGIDSYYAARSNVLKGMKAYYHGKDQGFKAEEIAFAEASGAYAAALDINQHDSAVRRLLNEMNFFGALLAAENFKRQGNYRIALPQLRAALEIQPDNPLVYNRMAVLFDEMGLKKQTEDSLRKALEIAPDYVVALNNLALFYLKTGATDDAKKLVQKSLEYGPYNVDARQLSKLIQQRQR